MASPCNVAMEVGSAGLGGCESNPEVSLSRRLPAVCSGYRGHAYRSRRGSRHGSALVLLRLEPLHRAGLGHGLSRLCVAGLRGGFRLLTVQLIYTFARHPLNQQFGERPYQGINAVRRIRRRGAVECKIRHLVFELREGADVMD